MMETLSCTKCDKLCRNLVCWSCNGKTEVTLVVRDNELQKALQLQSKPTKIIICND